ncbi:hypothetical protein PanWU01x14_331030 [Parasponia andersonii]|uniref:Uncharacterized protein n=1 Tax=Parasponia andersonii TaxID=3476 RepID=A0A2P5AHU4_PARAD|nr:hypothetical protein PanWU01x14_331030 [Parasponia andersonii]
MSLIFRIGITRFEFTSPTMTARLMFGLSGFVFRTRAKEKEEEEASSELAAIHHYRRSLIWVSLLLGLRLSKMEEDE